MYFVSILYMHYDIQYQLLKYSSQCIFYGILIVLAGNTLKVVASSSTASSSNGSSKGAFTAKSMGPCGAWTGSAVVEKSKEGHHPLSSSGPDRLNGVVLCEEHLRMHATMAQRTRVAGFNVVYPVFANRTYLLVNFGRVDVSASSKRLSDSSLAHSFVFFDSTKSLPTVIGFLVHISLEKDSGALVPYCFSIFFSPPRSPSQQKWHVSTNGLAKL
jgi:hypothetical protein